ncbi:hypothetical protein [Nocardioides sp.]|uniref:hypothetical protein n=1 Tax=Nocardioides sp. TaxID=35761 RepID=UPI0026018835|nr:hypothetical protein [Nocardioides sp.]
MTFDLPLSLRFAWWGTAWLRGQVSADDLLDAVRGEDAQHLVARLDGEVEGLLIGLGRARAAGASGIGVALPVEGDPVGLGGPATFNHAALEAGEAIVLIGTGLGLVPERTGAAVVWREYAASRRQLPDVGECDRALRAALPAAADELARLDVAHWSPDVADELIDLTRTEAPPAPDGIPDRCRDLAARALFAAGVVDLALVDDGGAVSLTEAAARRDALIPLDRCARRALVAAGSPEVWAP